jgi:hypothetical protein
MRRFLQSLVVIFALALAVPAWTPVAQAEGKGLSEEALPPQVDSQPNRPRPLIELGEDFLANGKFSKGWRLPTGAVWRPQLIAFGSWRTAMQSVDTGDGSFTEWANRLDLNLNLRLSGTERIFVGFRPLDDDGEFAGHRFDGDEDWVGDLDAEVRTAFFEGDFGEIFPKLDGADRRPLDFGFSFGRQPITFQDGMLIDDVVDSFGLVKNSLRPGGSSNLRVTALYAWDEVHRSFSGEDGDAREANLAGIFTTVDLPSTTLELDAVHVDAGEDRQDGLVIGASATQRLDRFATTFRVLISTPYAEKGPAMDEGRVFFGEMSWTPKGTHDHVYVSAFAVDGTYTPAARDPELGGPLARAGILYQAPGIGRYGAALSSRASETVGGAVGWQRFFAHGRRQLILEVAGRSDTNGSDGSEVAGGARWQQAFGNRTLLQLDGFISAGEGRGPAYGGRVEMGLKF